MPQSIPPRSLSGDQFRLLVNGQRNTLLPVEQYNSTPDVLKLRKLDGNESVLRDKSDNLVVKTPSGELVSIEADRLQLKQGFFSHEVSLPPAGAFVQLFDRQGSEVLSGQVVSTDKEDDLNTCQLDVIDAVRAAAIAENNVKHADEKLSQVNSQIADIQKQIAENDRKIAETLKQMNGR